MLLEEEGERVRVYTGLAMRMRLVRILGPARALRMAQSELREDGSPSEASDTPPPLSSHPSAGVVC